MATDMVCKQIYIRRQQQILLKQLARLRGTSEAEIIRRAIEREINTQVFPRSEDSHAALNEILQAAYARRTKPATGEAYHFTREELYEERG